MAGFLAQVPAFEQGVGAFGQQLGRQRTAVQQQHHGWFVQRKDGARQVVLLAEQVQRDAVAQVVVGPGFARGHLVVAQDHDDGVGRPGGFHGILDQAGIDFRLGELDLVLAPDALFGQAHALAVVEREALGARFLLQRLVDRDHVARDIGIAADRGVLRVGAEQQHLADPVRLQGQQVLVVLEQHRAAAGRLARQFDRIRGRGQGLGPGRVRVRVLEQPGVELQLQDAAHAGVDLLDRDPFFAHQVGQREVAQRVRGLDVDAGLDRLQRRLLVAGGQAVARDQFLDPHVVRHRGALEAPLLAQDVGQEPAAGVRRQAVDLVIRGHHGRNLRFLDDLLERREEILAQSALADVGRTDVGAALGLAVAGHVLEGRMHLVCRQRQGLAREADHGRLAHHAAQVRVFAIGFLDAAPARIARHVDHRRQRQVGAACTHLARRDREHLGHHGRVEARGQADRLREAGRLARRVAMQRFLVHQDRNAQASTLHRPFLHRVHVLGGLARAAVGGRT